MTPEDAYMYLSDNRIASLETILALSKIFDAIRSKKYKLVKIDDELDKIMENDIAELNEALKNKELVISCDVETLNKTAKEGKLPFEE